MKTKDPEHLDAYTDADSNNRKSTSGGELKVGSTTVRDFTKGQSCQTLLRGESEYYAAVTTTAVALLLKRLLEFLAFPVNVRLRITQRQHAASSGRGAVFSSISRQDSCGFKRITRKKEAGCSQGTDPKRTQQTDSRKCLQTAKYLERRNRHSKGYDNGDEVETSKREALAESGRWARVEGLHAILRSVLIATLMQQTFVKRRRGWNDWNWLSKA